MAELFFLGAQVLFGMRAWRDFAGNALDHLNSSAFESLDLVGIIREQPHACHAESLENSTWKREVAMVRLESQALIRLHGVETLVLQFVSLQLGHQADTASFLLFIDENPCTFFGDHRQREFELLPAVAAQRVKDVSSEALRVHADQRRGRLHIAHHQRDCFFDAAIAVGGGVSAKAVDAELAPARGELGRCHPFDCVFVHKFIIAAAMRRADQPRARNGKMASCLEATGEPFRVAG